MESIPEWVPTVSVILLIAIVGGIVKLCLWMGKKDGFESGVGTALEDIKKDIRLIQNAITDLVTRAGSKVVKSNSPLSLTDLGKAISRQLNVEEWAKAEATVLVARLNESTPYEIQQFCYEYVKGGEFRPSDDLLRKMQDSAYNNAITIDQLKEVFVVELRNALLKRLNFDPPD